MSKNKTNRLRKSTTWESAGLAVPENILRRVSFRWTKSRIRAFGATT